MKHFLTKKENLGFVIYFGIFLFKGLLEKNYSDKEFELKQEKFTFIAYFDHQFKFLDKKFFLSYSGYYHKLKSYQ